MASLRQKQHNKKKSNISTIPELTTAQLTFTKSNTPKQQENINAKEVLQQVQQLWFSNQCLQAINLLKGLKDYLRNTKLNDQSIQAIIHVNLGVCYYKAGFLQQSYDQFVGANASIKDLNLSNRMNANQGNSYRSKLPQKLRYDMLTTRIQLQTCILFSEMGKHQLALQHAKLSCKLAYNTIYDLQIALYSQLNVLLSKNKVLYSPSSDSQIYIEGQQNLLNNIAVLNHLIAATKDLKIGFLSKEKAVCYNEEVDSMNRYGKLPTKIDIDLLYGKMENQSVFWIYKNKILDEILIKYMKPDRMTNDSKVIEQNQVIQKIVFLAISLYCYSTETRFLQKSKQQTGDPSEVLDSQHWLSRSLEIAYSFLPSQAPILNQILTVHDRFHGIDKQTIPEDKEVGGFFKVLRPLSKPKTTYSSKNIMCSPIMIRIQVPKITILNNIEEEKEGNSPKKIDFANKTIDLDNLTKNNKIRGLNGPKKFDFTEYSQSTIRHKPQNKTDFSQNLKSIYATRKIKSVAEHEKPQRMKINLSGLSSRNTISEQERHIKSMRRPHSYDKQISNRQQELNLQVQTERKKKSLSLHKKQIPRQKRKTTSLNSTGLKLDGLQMLPNNIKKLQDEECFEFSQKMSSNMETTKIGGNIFINNNINLFISKDNIESNNNNNGKALTTKMKGDKTVYEISRRQNFINKRKAHQSNFTGVKNPQFL